MKIRSATACLIMIISVPGIANSENWDCSKPADLPQQGMNHCAQRDFEAADGDLNEFYKIARQSLIDIDNYQYRLNKDSNNLFSYQFSNVQKDMDFKLFF